MVVGGWQHRGCSVADGEGQWGRLGERTEYLDNLDEKVMNRMTRT